MFGCLNSSKYTMTVLVRKVTVVQDEVSGGIKRVWVDDKVLDAYVRPFLPRATGFGTEITGQLYSNSSFARMLTREPIPLGNQITKITDKNTGQYIWKEDYIDPDVETDANKPTVFNVNACVPIIGPFGNVMEYQSILERKE